MVIAATVSWIGQAFFQTLIDKVSDTAIQLFIMRRGLENDINKLRVSLSETRFILGKAETKCIEDSNWEDLMNTLKDAAYDADDLIDEFQYHVVKKEINGGEEEDRANGYLSNLFTAATKLFTSYDDETGTRLREVQGRLDRIASSMKSILNLLAMDVTGKQPEVKYLARETSSFSAVNTVFGREEELNQAVEWLLGSVDEDEHRSVNSTFPVMSIVGIGGVGKTTLAQLAYNDDRIHDHFHLRAWICVSDNFTIKRLTKSMIESVTKKEQSDELEFDVLQNILKGHLMSKRFLLVLDDVWSQDKLAWENFCAVLKVGAHGSKIIVTTRNMKVSSAVGATHAILLDGLKNDDYWELFKKCAFGSLSPDHCPELRDIGRKIASKLKGSPLAAKTLGGVLQSDLSHHHWRAIMESNVWEVEQGENGIMPALQLSYRYLDEPLKRCFAFCSLFPKDYQFSKVKLIQIWAAEGFIKSKNMARLEDVGRHYFLEFVNRSFFQEVKSHMSIRYVMHDLIHDLAEMVSAGETCRIEEGKQTKMHGTLRHLQVLVDDEHAKKIVSQKFFRYNKLRTLSVAKSLHDPESLFEKLGSIRVLNLSCCGLKKLSDNIGKLIQLRYLDISWNFCIEILPDSLCDLYNLQILKVVGCIKLKSLPQEMCKLINLRHIEADDMVIEQINSVGRLTNLQELSAFGVREDDRHKLTQLSSLTQLHGRLCIKNLENVVDKKEAKTAELRTKVHLEELVLQWSRDNNAALEEEVVEGLQPHNSLKALTIRGYNGARSPSWLMPGVLHELEAIELRGCKRWDDVLPFIGQRPNLKKLHMENMPDLKQLLHEFEDKCFPRLEELELCNLSAMEKWSWTEGKELFPSLRILRVKFCPKLKRIPPLPPSLIELHIVDVGMAQGNENVSRLLLPSSLKILELHNCGNFGRLLPSCLHNLKLLTILDMTNCPFMLTFPLAQLVELEYLYIRNCDELRSIEGLRFLKSLKRLSIIGCPKLLQLDEGDEQEGGLSLLQELWIHNTVLLKMVPLKSSLPFVKRLTTYLSSEEVIFEGEEELLRKLIALQFLCFYKCEKLQSLPTELYSLPSLLDLCIKDCPKILSLPEKGLPLSLRKIDCWGDVHPTLEEQVQKYNAKRMNKSTRFYTVRTAEFHANFV